MMTKQSDFQNILSFDVEEWFHLRRTEDIYPREQWGAMPARLPEALARVLELLAETGNRATFFWLGWCAERYPEWVKRVAEAGHEIACHGYAHEAVDRLSPEAFRSEVRRTRALLENLSVAPVRGFRAPSLSLGADTAWMLEVLAEEGFTYDSSLMVCLLRYNYPDPALNGARASAPLPNGLAPKLRDVLPWRHDTRAGTIVELPISVCSLGPIRLPYAGGLFFRFAPYWAVAAEVRRINRRQIPLIFYAHPWEIDLDSPSPEQPGLERFSHRFRKASGLKKYQRLLRDFRFTSAGESLGNMSTIQPVEGANENA